MARGRGYAKKTAGIQWLYVEKEKPVKYGTLFKRRQKGVKPRSILEATRLMEASLLWLMSSVEQQYPEWFSGSREMRIQKQRKCVKIPTSTLYVRKSGKHHVYSSHWYGDVEENANGWEKDTIVTLRVQNPEYIRLTTRAAHGAYKPYLGIPCYDALVVLRRYRRSARHVERRRRSPELNTAWPVTENPYSLNLRP